MTGSTFNHGTRACRVGRLALALALASGAIWGAASPTWAADAKAEDPSAVDEILGILKKRGDIDDEEYQRLVTKNAKHEEKKEAEWFDRITLFGDVRSRYDGQFYEDNPVTGTRNADRSRGRFRARIGVSAVINDYTTAVVRLATSQGDSRSENQTFGNPANFGTTAIWVDQAYIQLRTKSGQLPEGGSATFQAGRVVNPFQWKVGQDRLLWDSDITPSGAVLQLGMTPFSEMRVFLNSGYFISQENASDKDPHFLGTQLGAELTPTEDWKIGSRLSWYFFDSLNTAFIRCGVASTSSNTCATNGGGNIADGLTGNANGGSMNVGEVGGYVTWRGFEDWPVTLYGSWARNFSASQSQVFQNVSYEDVAWDAGFEVGDKTKWLKLGIAYFHVDANAFPSQFIDSDIADGFTNREAWILYASRQIFANTDLGFSLSKSDAIVKNLAHSNSLSGSDRYRAIVDLDVKF